MSYHRYCKHALYDPCKYSDDEQEHLSVIEGCHTYHKQILLRKVLVLKCIVAEVALEGGCLLYLWFHTVYLEVIENESTMYSLLLLVKAWREEGGYPLPSL